MINANLLVKCRSEDLKEEEEEEEYFYLTLYRHYTNTGHHGNQLNVITEEKYMVIETNKIIGPGDFSKTITVAIEEPPKCGIKLMQIAK